jgi:hypothetical protein
MSSTRIRESRRGAIIYPAGYVLGFGEDRWPVLPVPRKPPPPPPAPPPESQDKVPPMAATRADAGDNVPKGSSR